MIRNFRTSLKRQILLVALYPPCVWLLIATSALTILLMVTFDAVFLYLLLTLWVLYWVVTLPSLAGKVPWLHMEITTHFFGVRTLTGALIICQRRSKGTCREQRHTLAHESDIAACLPSGRYRTLTHETVVLRVQRTAGVQVQSCRPVYKMDLHHILTAMTGGACKRCTKKCSAWKAPARQFYDLKFTIK